MAVHQEKAQKNEQFFIAVKHDEETGEWMGRCVKSSMIELKQIAREWIIEGYIVNIYKVNNLPDGINVNQ